MPPYAAVFCVVPSGDKCKQNDALKIKPIKSICYKIYFKIEGTALLAPSYFYKAIENSFKSDIIGTQATLVQNYKKNSITQSKEGK